MRAYFVTIFLSALLCAPAFAQEPVAALVPALQVPAALAPAVPRPERPAALVPLYSSLVALQAMDVHSTRTALSRTGVVEANPIMAPLVRNAPAFVIVKASTTVGLVWVTERMWKRNRKAAVIFAAVANAGLALVVAHNYRVASRTR